MGFADFMRITNTINNFCTCSNNVLTDISSGVNPTYSLFSNSINYAWGQANINEAYNMQRHHNSWGNFVVSNNGFGNYQANAMSTLALSACSPRMFFCGMGMYNMGMYGMGGMGMYSPYGFNSFWC